MLNAPDRKVFTTLRIASAMCFIGHGAFGLITKKIWLNYFAVFGIGPELGHRLMPLVGTMDILLGISLLLYPTRAVFTWLVVWGTTTALLRPLSGEPFAEAIERAGNYGAPFALLLLCEARGKLGRWLSRIDFDVDIKPTPATVVLALRVVVALLLLGHGWLNLLEKPAIIDQYAALGASHPAALAHLVGAFECLAAVSVLFRPMRGLVLALLIWKIGSELLYPQWEIFEWVERGGSYGALLALWLVQGQRRGQISRSAIGAAPSRSIQCAE